MKLYRRNKNEERLVLGICGGLADYFKTDETLVRLAVSFLFLIFPEIIFLYIFAYFIMPVKEIEREKDSEPVELNSKNEEVPSEPETSNETSLADEVDEQPLDESSKNNHNEEDIDVKEDEEIEHNVKITPHDKTLEENKEIHSMFYKPSVDSKTLVDETNHFEVDEKDKDDE